MKKISYLFPGQGAQYVGMGKDLYESSKEAKSVFDDAENVLPEVGIKKLCFEGPIEELTKTSNAQVTILVVSIACLEALNVRVDEIDKKRDRRFHSSPFILHPVACAGLSLGELTSLVASKSVGFKDAVRLVRRRGELMEEASLKNPGAMASIIGLSLEDLKGVCNETGAEIANLNCPGQIVISGTKESVVSCMELALKKGARKSILLNVSGAFHSSLMKRSAGLFKIELDKVKFSNPEIPVISNVTASYVETAEEIKDNLVKQLFSPVRWEESVRKIASLGVDSFFEIGPGKVLKGLLRRIDANLKVYNIEKVEDISNLTV